MTYMQTFLTAPIPEAKNDRAIARVPAEFLADKK